MEKNKTIQRIFASLLLGCFILSNTPKTFLHDVFAGHKDYVVICEHSSPCIHEQNVDCDFDNLVVNTHYTLSCSVPCLSLSKNFIAPPSRLYISVYKPSWFYFRDYTGPPLFA